MKIDEIHERLEAFINDELPKLNKLNDYYEGRHAILKKEDRSEDKKDTKEVHNYAMYISDIATGYFVGEPIAYKLQKEDEKTKAEFDKLKDYLMTEEEQQENYEHASNCSIFGKSYELWYGESINSIDNTVLDPRDALLIRDNTVAKKVECAVRYDLSITKENKFKYMVEVYDKLKVVTYEYELDNNEKVTPDTKPISEKLHGFNEVPIIEFVNNKRKMSDIEKVITLIDSYNAACSTSVDDLEDFTDAYLMLKNMGGTTTEDIKDMNKNKVLLVETDGDAKWLVKQVNDEYSQNIKERLNNDIHKFSMTPDMTDEKFSGNSSGVAFEFKLLPLEQLVSQKEMYFKKAINERLDLIIAYHNYNIKSQDIQKVFNRNKPQNLIEIADVVTKLTGTVSKGTLISKIPFVEDATKEMEAVSKENDIYGDYGSLGGQHEHKHEE